MDRIFIPGGQVDPLFILVLAGLVGLFIFLFLFVRRTLLSFKEGFQNSNQ